MFVKKITSMMALVLSLLILADSASSFFTPLEENNNKNLNLLAETRTHKLESSKKVETVYVLYVNNKWTKESLASELIKVKLALDKVRKHPAAPKFKSTETWMGCKQISTKIDKNLKNLATLNQRLWKYTDSEAPEIDLTHECLFLLEMRDVSKILLEPIRSANFIAEQISKTAKRLKNIPATTSTNSEDQKEIVDENNENMEIMGKTACDYIKSILEASETLKNDYENRLGQLNMLTNLRASDQLLSTIESGDCIGAGLEETTKILDVIKTPSGLWGKIAVTPIEKNDIVKELVSLPFKAKNGVFQIQWAQDMVMIPETNLVGSRSICSETGGSLRCPEKGINFVRNECVKSVYSADSKGIIENCVFIRSKESENPLVYKISIGKTIVASYHTGIVKMQIGTETLYTTPIGILHTKPLTILSGKFTLEIDGDQNLELKQNGIDIDLDTTVLLYNETILEKFADGAEFDANDLIEDLLPDNVEEGVLMGSIVLQIATIIYLLLMCWTKFCAKKFHCYKRAGSDSDSNLSQASTKKAPPKKAKKRAVKRSPKPKRKTKISFKGDPGTSADVNSIELASASAPIHDYETDKLHIPDMSYKILLSKDGSVLRDYTNC